MLEVTRNSFTGVALRKESVDRNILRGQLPTPEPPSLSARRAWIEMVCFYVIDHSAQSLSARRAWIEIAMTGQISVSTVGRSPQGERG